MKQLRFTVYMRAEPQGSARAFVVPGANRANVTCDNRKLKPFRSELTRMALAEMGDVPAPLFGAKAPVRLGVECSFLRPPSAKRRPHPSVKPDVDKLARAVLDSLTGVAFQDDAQVVELRATKVYGAVERVTVTVEGV